MARRKSVPSYCLHKPSGQAVVYIDRKPHYLGVHDSADSRRAYGELLARLASEERAIEATKPPAKPAVTIAELCLRFVTDELPRYSPAEQHCQRTAIRVLRQLFGETAVDEFGPLRLRVVRDAMVQGDPNAKPARKPWSRDTVNRQVKRLQSMFRWGVSWEMVPEHIAGSLATVRILAAGETAAKESTPRRAVSQSDFDAVAAELRPRARDILTLLSLTGARPGELIGLRMKDIDRSGEVWRAELKRHKTAHKGKRRVLFFNLAAQAVLMRHFKADPDARLFPVRRDNFGAAVKRACKRAKVTPFLLMRSSNCRSVGIPPPGAGVSRNEMPPDRSSGSLLDMRMAQKSGLLVAARA